MAFHFCSGYRYIDNLARKNKMKAWYLAYCRPKEEERASQHLRNQEIDSYYPMVEVERMVRGRRTKRMEPLFPCYLFVHVDLDDCPPTRLNSTRGIRRIVRFGGNWSVVPKELVYNMMCHEDSDELRLQLCQLPKRGEKVKIKSGPFSGLDAIYQEPDGETRSILLLDMLQRQVPHSLDNLEFVTI